MKRGLDFWNAALNGEGVAELEEEILGEIFLVVNRDGKRTVERVAWPLHENCPACGATVEFPMKLVKPS